MLCSSAGWSGGSLSKYLILALLLILVLRLSPIPRQVEGTSVVHTYPSWRVSYAHEDGSFMVLVVAGCLPWRSCGINEATDWWVGGE